jgi:hypothetical protein
MSGVVTCEPFTEQLYLCLIQPRTYQLFEQFCFLSLGQFTLRCEAVQFELPAEQLSSWANITFTVTEDLSTVINQNKAKTKTKKIKS